MGLLLQSNLDSNQIKINSNITYKYLIFISKPNKTTFSAALICAHFSLKVDLKLKMNKLVEKEMHVNFNDWWSSPKSIINGGKYN